MAQVTAQTLIEALEPLAAEHGLELVDVELVGAKKAPTCRVYLDSEGGISFDEIVEANRWIDAYFEQADPFPGAYVLEVSSPGIDRPLRKLDDFARFAGQKAQIVFAQDGGKHKRTGVLLGVEGTDVLLELESDTIRIPHGQITKAHLKGEVDFSKKGKE